MNSKGLSCGYRFTNQVALNESHPDLPVNFIEYWEVDKNGKQTLYAWVTSLPITADNAYQIARADRLPATKTRGLKRSRKPGNNHTF